MSKIDDYKFGEIVMKFREEGKSYEYIAKTLNEAYLPQDEERISVMAVQRWCKKYTEAQNSKALVKRTSKEMIESAVNNLPTREVDDENINPYQELSYLVNDCDLQIEILKKRISLNQNTALTSKADQENMNLLANYIARKQSLLNDVAKCQKEMATYDEVQQILKIVVETLQKVSPEAYQDFKKQVSDKMIIKQILK